jgi:hypothetical protein
VKVPGFFCWNFKQRGNRLSAGGALDPGWRLVRRVP